MKTFNKKGDRGETSLLYGVRVAKSHPRCEAYGTIDEVVSAIGLARCFCRKVRQETLLDVQRELFVVGSELATPPEHYAKLTAKGCQVTAEMVDRLEKAIDQVESTFEMPERFVLPGSVPGAAALDMARSVLRRAERRVVELAQSGQVQNEQVGRYLNRLADLLFTLARYEEGEKRVYV